MFVFDRLLLSLIFDALFDFACIYGCGFVFVWLLLDVCFYGNEFCNSFLTIGCFRLLLEKLVHFMWTVFIVNWSSLCYAGLNFSFPVAVC